MTAIPKVKSQNIQLLLQKQREKIKEMNNRCIDYVLSMNKSISTFNNWKVPEHFYKAEIMRISRNLERVVFLPEQKLVFSELCREICGILPLHDFVIMGFIRRAIRQWQKEVRQSIVTLTEKNPFEELQIMSRVLKHAITLMGRGVYIPNKELKERLLSEVYRLALESYEEVSSTQRMLKVGTLDEMSLDPSMLI